MEGGEHPILLQEPKCCFCGKDENEDERRGGGEHPILLQEPQCCFYAKDEKLDERREEIYILSYLTSPCVVFMVWMRIRMKREQSEQPVLLKESKCCFYGEDENEDERREESSVLSYCRSSSIASMVRT